MFEQCCNAPFAGKNMQKLLKFISKESVKLFP